MITNYNLFLDDERLPNHVTWVDLPPNQHYSLVRNYQEFVDLITLRGIPKFVTYDHDLASVHYGHGLQGDSIPYDKYTEKTGYDCAKWLVDYCLDNKLELPLYNIQSSNPAGKENIDKLLKNYIKCIQNI